MRISDWSSDVCSSDLGSQNALGGVHAMNIFGAGFDPNQNNRLAQFRAALGGVSIEHDDTGRSARRSGKPLGQHVAGSLWIKRRVKKLLERGRIHAGDSKIGRASCRERGCQYV